MPSFKPSDEIAVLGTIDPDAYSTGAQNSDWASFEYFEAMMFVVQAGILNSGATLDFKLQEAKSSTGLSAADLSGKSITQFTTGDNDKQAIINLRAEELSAGFTHARGVMTVTTTGGDASAICLGFKPVHGPASGHDLSTVDEIVA